MGKTISRKLLRTHGSYLADYLDVIEWPSGRRTETITTMSYLWDSGPMDAVRLIEAANA